MHNGVVGLYNGASEALAGQCVCMICAVCLLSISGMHAALFGSQCLHACRLFAIVGGLLGLNTPATWFDHGPARACAAVL